MLPNSQHPFYIVAPPFVQSSAGIRCQHLLCHALNIKGQTAYIVLDFTHSEPEQARIKGLDLQTPYLTQEIADIHFQQGRQPTTVYSETISGNPCNAGSAVRFFFNFPELLNANILYSENEYQYSFSHEIARETKYPENILFIPSINTSVFKMGDQAVHRQGACFYADKYRKVHKQRPTSLTDGFVEITRQQEHSQSPDEIAHLFRTSEAFYTYENTALAIEAVLCGCPTIFIPNPYLTHIIGLEVIGKEGYCWGVDHADIERAKATVEVGARNYEKVTTLFWQHLDDFIARTTAFACERPPQPFTMPSPSARNVLALEQAAQWNARCERAARSMLDHPFLTIFLSFPQGWDVEISKFLGTIGLRKAGSVLWNLAEFRRYAQPDAKPVFQSALSDIHRESEIAT